jgi:hypothetical protein
MLTFLTKLVLNGVIVIPLLLVFTNATVMQATLSAIILCIVAYLLGDLVILRRTNNTIATFADIALAYMFFLIVGNAFNWTLSGIELLALSLAVGVVEMVFHFIIASRMKQAV